MNNRSLTIAAVVVGILFVILSVYYWVTPAGALFSFMPGFENGSTHIHLKHGFAALIVGLGVFAYAWFKSGKKDASQRSKNTNEDSAPAAKQ